MSRQRCRWTQTSRLLIGKPSDLSLIPAPQSERALRIVVADDDPDTVFTLATILRDEGHDVCRAYRGDAVLDQVRSCKPDAVLLDIGMPGLSGFEIARRLRKELGEACPLLVAITGLHEQSAKTIGKLAGFHHYLTKPYSTDALLDLLAQLIHPSRSTKA
jgi:CheY-like chemotaxis protein